MADHAEIFQPARQVAIVIRSSQAKPRSSRVTAAPTGKPEVRIFLSYSHKDEASRIKLETHLAQLKRDGVSTWFDGDLDAGDALDPNIARQLRRAHVFVALISPDYLASTYCWDMEYKRAMGRRARGTMRVIGLLLRPCDWRNTRAADFKLLPKDGRPVSEWRPADKAYLDAANGVRAVVKAIRSEWSAAEASNVPAAKKPTAATVAKKAAGLRKAPSQASKAPSVRRTPSKRPAK